MKAHLPITEWLTAADAASRLGLNVNTIYRYMRDGRVASGRMGKKIRINPAEVDRILRDGIPPEPGVHAPADTLVDDPLA